MTSDPTLNSNSCICASTVCPTSSESFEDDDIRAFDA
eukprot:CAMPEP_0179375954 /NCGR_PEP_ID=MMETSP0797-20121207/88067_1 /TAXON_ID=47934 /ORGANISM="Dinophysis acuminata, Strain DAEP01" /LENGTH=36 /DNA_ID= /DNA_START= /DNA_END= /DNA_ORIENTATION=